MTLPTSHRTPRTTSLALLGLEARIGLVDHVDAALAAHELAVAVTALEGLQGAANFHSGDKNFCGGQGCPGDRKARSIVSTRSEVNPAHGCNARPNLGVYVQITMVWSRSPGTALQFNPKL